MGAYENTVVEEGTREELVREFLAAREENALLWGMLKVTHAACALNASLAGRPPPPPLPSRDEVTRAELESINPAETDRS